MKPNGVKPNGVKPNGAKLNGVVVMVFEYGENSPLPLAFLARTLKFQEKLLSWLANCALLVPTPIVLFASPPPPLSSR